MGRADRKKYRLPRKTRRIISFTIIGILLAAIIFGLVTLIGKLFFKDKPGTDPKNPSQNEQQDPGSRGEKDPNQQGSRDEKDPNQQGSQGQDEPDPQPAGPTPEELEQQRLEALRQEEYLVLVNKTHPLGEDDKPSDLVTVKYTVDGVGNSDTKKLRRVAAEAFEAMADAAAKDGIKLKMRTGFRSYSYQKSLFNSYVKNNGEEKANTFSARAGQSEHQTGLALDVSGETSKWALTYSFGDTKEGKWILEHSHEYGFILRFNDGTRNSVGPITKYVYEPWHIRYVGEEHAAAIHEKGITLEEYLQILD